MFTKNWLKHALVFAALQYNSLVFGQETNTEVKEDFKERGPPIGPTAIFLD